MDVVLIGAGRTGGRIAMALAAKGAKLAIVDRDCVEDSDLVDSPAFSAADVGKMKATVLADKVRHYNRDADVLAVCEHFCGTNASELLGPAQIVIDATDNWRSRATINEWCWHNEVPWVYCGALGAKAMAAAIVPPQKPCWLCWNKSEPAEVLSCSTWGIDARAADKAAQKAVELAMEIANGNSAAAVGRLFFVDVQAGIETESPLVINENCAVCAKENYALLSEAEKPELVCGSGQWLFPNASLEAKVRHYTASELAQRLGRHARVVESVVRVEQGESSAIVFSGGRATVRAASERDAQKLNDEIVSRLLA